MEIRKKLHSIMRRIEPANIIDELGSIFVMIFIIALILVFTSYGKLTQQRLAINNIAKEYLYKMEETGYLSVDDMVKMETDMKEIGVTELTFGPETDTQQVTYGDSVTLAFHVVFPNPLFSTFSQEDSYIKILGFDPDLGYDVNISSTAKW